MKGKLKFYTLFVVMLTICILISPVTVTAVDTGLPEEAADAEDSDPVLRIQVDFDDAYRDRKYGGDIPLTYGHIKHLTDKARDAYLLRFGIYINFIKNEYPTRNDADRCNPYYAICICSDSCANSNSSTLQTFHHKNVYNIFYRISRPPKQNGQITYAQMFFSGHIMCFVQNGNHSIDHSFYGLCSESLGVLSIHNFEDFTQEYKTVIHEIGHLYNVPDHYGAGDQNPECIWGSNRGDSEIINNFTVCSSCWLTIEANKYKYAHY